MNSRQNKDGYYAQPMDSDIKNIVAQFTETKQRLFLRFLQFIKARKPDPSQTLVLKNFSHIKGRPISILIEEFKYMNISEIEIFSFLQILKKIYNLIPQQSFKKGVLEIYSGLPKLNIVTGPDDKKYITGLDVEIVIQTHKILLNKYGETELITIEKNKVNTFVESKSSISKKYFLDVKDKYGYFQFYKQGLRIQIAKVNTRQWRLMSTLINDGVCVIKKVDIVFEKITLERDKLDGKLKSTSTSSARKLEIIRNTVKELQKNKKLKKRITLSCYSDSKSIKLDIM